MLIITETRKEAHHLAADRYAAAEEILHARTGLYVTAAVAAYGSLEAIAAAHPDIGPGFSGLPFSEDN